MDIQQVYAELCKKLGDINYKQQLLRDQQKHLLAEIKKLDKIAAEQAKAQAQAQETADETQKQETEVSAT